MSLPFRNTSKARDSPRCYFEHCYRLMMLQSSFTLVFLSCAILTFPFFLAMLAPVSFNWSVHCVVMDRNILTTIGWFAMKFRTGTHGPLRMNHSNFGDHLTFHSGTIIRSKFQLKPSKLMTFPPVSTLC